jgi:transposase
VAKFYAGLDLHKSNVFCAIKDQEGKPIYRHRWPAELPTILQSRVPYRSHRHAVAVESTYNWYWLVDGLQAAGYPAGLANPAAMIAYSGIKQTNDQSEAPWLGDCTNQ